MWVDVDVAENITHKAAWKVSQNLPCATEVAAAKGWVSEAYKNIVHTGLQIHGAIGITKDHDLGLYFRRAKAAELAFGDTEFQREMMARQLGL